MMHAAAYGRLGQDPKPMTTKGGAGMCVASIAVDLCGRNGEQQTLWLGVVAFGSAADDLAAHKKGEALGISGKVSQRQYTNREGAEVTELQIVADSIISARAIRPGTRRRKPKSDGDAEVPASDGLPLGDGQDEFRDEIGF